MPWLKKIGHALAKHPFWGFIFFRTLTHRFVRLAPCRHSYLCRTTCPHTNQCKASAAPFPTTEMNGRFAKASWWTKFNELITWDLLNTYNGVCRVTAYMKYYEGFVSSVSNDSFLYQQYSNYFVYLNARPSNRNQGSWRQLERIKKPANMGLTSPEAKIKCANCINFREFPEEFCLCLVGNVGA